MGETHPRKPLLCLLERRSFSLHNVQRLWTAAAERLEKGGGCQTATQPRAQRWQNKGGDRDGHGEEGAILPSCSGLSPHMRLRTQGVWGAGREGCPGPPELRYGVMVRDC